jgi:hypothetical protein
VPGEGGCRSHGRWWAAAAGRRAPARRRTASPTGKPRHRHIRRGQVPASRSTHPLCRDIRPRTACQLIPPSPAECSYRHRKGRRSIDTSAKYPPGRHLNEWPGPVSCHPHGGAAGADRPDTVQRVRIGDRVTVHGEDISVEPGRDAPLAVPVLAFPGRGGGDRTQRLGRPNPSRRSIRPRLRRESRGAGSSRQAARLKARTASGGNPGAAGPSRQAARL